MAQRGSFARMFEKMVQLMGENELGSLVMFSSASGNDYILVTPEDAVRMKKIDVDSDLRVVLAPSYNELRYILKPRQGDVFEKAESGGDERFGYFHDAKGHIDKKDDDGDNTKGL